MKPLWPLVSKQPGIHAATGQLEGVVTLPDAPGEYLRILGIDIFTADPFRTFRLEDARATPGTKNQEPRTKNFRLETWIGQPGAVAITPDFAHRLHLKIGDKLRVLANGIIKDLTVAAFLDDPDPGAALPERFAVMDIGWAQELLARQGLLSSVQLLLDDPNSRPERRRAPERRASPGSPRRSPAPAQLPGAEHALRVPAQSHRSEHGLAAGRRLPHLQHHLRIRRAEESRDRHPALPRRHTRRDPLPVPRRSLLFWHPRHRHGRPLRNRSGQSPLRRRRRNDLLPLRPPQHRSKLAEPRPIRRCLHLRRAHRPRRAHGSPPEKPPESIPSRPSARAATRSSASPAAAAGASSESSSLPSPASHPGSPSPPDPVMGLRRRLLHPRRIRLLRLGCHRVLRRPRRHSVLARHPLASRRR